MSGYSNGNQKEVVITPEAIELQRGGELKKFQDQILSLKNQIHALNFEKDNLEDLISGKKKDFEEVVIEGKASINKSLDGLRKQKSDLEDEISNIERRIESKRSELKNIKVGHDKRKDELDDREDKIRSDRSRLDKDIEANDLRSKKLKLAEAELEKRIEDFDDYKEKKLSDIQTLEISAQNKLKNAESAISQADIKKKELAEQEESFKTIKADAEEVLANSQIAEQERDKFDEDRKYLDEQTSNLKEWMERNQSEDARLNSLRAALANKQQELDKRERVLRDAEKQV